MAATRTILVIVTNVDSFETVGYRTGLWLGELVEFWDVAEEAGHRLEIASPTGGRIPIDPGSLILTQMGEAVGLKGSVAKRYADRAFMDLLDDTMAVADVDASRYDAIYLTGGHGVMFDFPTSDELAGLIARFFEDGRVVSAVCHGPSGLLNVRLGNGEALLSGRDVTGFSWTEEGAAKRDDAVPFNLEEELERRGARYSRSKLPFMSHVVEDGSLITGQNPRSAKGVGEAVVRRLASDGDDPE